MSANTAKYLLTPVREFCAQYQETDLAFISRLMEESGIWYCFADKKQPDGTHREYAVVTDDFSKYPMLGRAIPFKKGSGTAEITSAGKIIESINSLSVRAALAPQNVRVRSYSHHVPESPPDGNMDITGGRYGAVCEYGGTLRNGREPSITIDSNGNAMVLNGKDNLITMESEGSKIAVDGQNNKILLESNDNNIAVDGSGNSITLDSATLTINAKSDIIFKAGGKIILDAKGGILNKSRTIDLDQDNAAGGAAGSGDVETEQKRIWAGPLSKNLTCHEYA